MERKSLITNIDSKIKATRWFTLKDLALIGLFNFMLYAFRSYIHGYVLIPYFIFNAVVSIFLVLPSGFNKKRSMMESVFLLFQNDRETYRAFHIPINYEEGEDIDG